MKRIEVSPRTHALINVLFIGAVLFGVGAVVNPVYDYFTQSQADDRFINEDGDTVTAGSEFNWALSTHNLGIMTNCYVAGWLDGTVGGNRGELKNINIGANNQSTSDFNLNNQYWYNAPTPTNNSQIASKSYVDGQVAAASATNHVDGSLYQHSASNSYTLGVADTYYLLTNWTQGHAEGVTLSGSNITVTADGHYVLFQNLSFSGTANRTFVSSFYRNGVALDEGDFKRKLGAGGDVGAAASSFVEELNIGDVIDLRVKCVGNTATFTVEEANFGVFLVSSVTAGTNWAQHPAAQNVNLGGNALSNGTLDDSLATNRTDYWSFNVATSATYTTMWIGPFDEARTLVSAFSQCDGGTALVYVVESATNTAWATTSVTNNQLAVTTSSSTDSTWTDATLAVGQKLGVKYVSGTCTQLMVTVKNTFDP